MLAAASVAKLLAEIALAALMGQWVLGLMTGAARERNPVYRVLEGVGRPWVRIARWLCPSQIERHAPLVAFVLLALLWIAAAAVKVSVCLQMGVALCR